MSYILRRDHWGETSTKWVLEGIEELFKTRGKTMDCKVINKDQETIPVSDWCVRWATTSSVPGNPKVINRADAIHRVYNKGVFRKKLADAGLAPKTWINEYPDEYPVVIRPVHHGRSEDLYIAHNKKDATGIIREILKENEGFYCSEFIDKDKEFRVFAVQGRSVGMCEKIPEEADNVSWGCVGDGIFQYIKWSQWDTVVTKTALEAFNLSGLDFGAVDVILKGSGNSRKAYVLEINTGPDLSEYWGYQMGCGIGHILETESRETIPFGPSGNWKSYIHPGQSDSAEL
jgi:glutathione synthase/RimK-type ligase-like ATP-grasp enzyme